MILQSHQEQQEQQIAQREQAEAEDRCSHRLAPTTITTVDTNINSSVPQDQDFALGPRGAARHAHATPTSGQSRPSTSRMRNSKPRRDASNLDLITKFQQSSNNSNHNHQSRIRVRIPQATIKSRATTILLATLLLLTTTTCFQYIPSASGFLFEQQTPAAAAAATADQSSPQSSSSQAAASPGSPASGIQSVAGGLIATIVDQAAKAAISSLSAPSTSSSAASNESPASALAPAAKSLGAGSSSASGSSSPAAGGTQSSTSSASSRQSPAGSSPSSIVASLSSAVASAAVASAVAAARNSLAPSPFGSAAKRANAKSSSASSSRFNSQSTQGRSTSSTSNQSSNSINNANKNHQQHSQQSPLNHIAMRLADAIPEVPYSILHNMKKLDHAAPFYNVDSSPVSKASGSQASLAAAAGGGIRKESSPLSAALSSLLQSAISAASGIQSGSSSVEQIGALFRTPLWRRLAEGYGDFAAEFRSFFKPGSSATAAASSPAGALSGPSKASGGLGGSLSQLGSMSNLMRELSVSVPVVMFLANKAIKSDWRPTRTNRKSFMQNILGTQSSTPASPLEATASSVSASPLTGNFLGSLATATDPMQTSGLDSAAQLVGNQLLNAMQFQQQPQSQAQFFPSFVQSPLMQAAQDAIQQQQQQRVGAILNRRMGDQMPQVASDNANYNLNGINLNLNGNQEMKINNADNAALMSSGGGGGGEDSSLRPLDIKPVQSQAQDGATNGPLTLLSKLGQHHHEAPRLNGANWLDSQSHSGGAQGRSAEAGASAKSVSEMLSKTGKFLQNLLHNSANSNVNQQQQSKRRHDDTKLIALNDKHRYSLLVESSDGLSAAPPSPQKSLLPAVSYIVGLANIPAHKIESGSTMSIKGKQSAVTPLEPLPQPQAQIQTQIHSTSTPNSSGQPEQRDLTQLVPQAWKDAVKRTYSNVQHSASTQWRSIEGQISGWLKPSAAPAVPAYHQSGTAPSPSAHNHFHTPPGGAASQQNPVSGFFSSMSSAAVNMLGLGNKQQQAPSHNQAPAAPASSTSQTTVASNSSEAKPAPKQTGLASMATLILNTITGNPKAGQNNQAPSTQTSKTPGSSLPSSSVAAPSAA